MNWNVFMFLVILSCTFSSIFCNDNVEKQKIDENNVKVGEKQLSTQIFALLEHYKQKDPIGLPGVPVPDPMPIPDIKQSISIGNLHMQNVLSYGLSKFRIKHVKFDLKNMKVNTGVQLDTMTIKGNYTLSAFLSRSQGPCTVILKNVFVQGNASLAVERDGKLRTQSVNMDITFSNMAMDFENLGFLGSLFQGIVNSASNLVFDAIKPFMLREAYSKIQTELDTQLAKMSDDYSFPNSISPLDMAVAELRKKVRDMGYDPFKVKDYNHTVGLLGVQMSNTWITGISSFYRVGNITIIMENNIVSLGMQIGTQRIIGTTQWEVALGSGMLARAGQAQFTLEYIKVEFELSQSLDTRNRPILKDIQLELGNIQVRCDGAGTLDYVIEFVVNILPNLLRYQIMDAIENPIKMRIQEMMNDIDVEKIIKEKVPEFEKMGMNMQLDFKLPL